MTPRRSDATDVAPDSGDAPPERGGQRTARAPEGDNAYEASGARIRTLPIDSRMLFPLSYSLRAWSGADARRQRMRAEQGSRVSCCSSTMS